jgi:hypothetical protein
MSYKAYSCPACGHATITEARENIVCDFCGRPIPAEGEAKKPITREYKYFRIVETAQKPKTKVFSVINKSSGFELGTIAWYGPWRQYCFLPEGNTVFSKGCLKDIEDFINEMSLEG